MTEVPEHLLKRSQDRRSALGLGGGDGGGDAAPAAASAATSTDVSPSAAPAAAAVVEAKPKAPVFVPPYVQASERRQRIPIWATAVLAFLPVWAVVYAQSLSAAPTTELTQLEAGAAVYADSQPCAGCHGGGGGGGSGRKLSDGDVVKTFPNIAGQLEFVWLGSDGYSGKPFGNPSREGGPRIGGAFGKMPTFKGLMSETELLEVVRHEREIFGKEDPETFKVDTTGHRLWPNGKPMLNDAGKLVWDDGTLMFDADGKLTKQIDQTKPAS